MSGARSFDLRAVLGVRRLATGLKVMHYVVAVADALKIAATDLGHSPAIKCMADLMQVPLMKARIFPNNVTTPSADSDSFEFIGRLVTRHENAKKGAGKRNAIRRFIRIYRRCGLTIPSYESVRHPNDI
jgi:hypothetical protein